MKISLPDNMRERGACGPASPPGHGPAAFGRSSAVRFIVGLCLVVVVSGVVIFEGLGRASFHGDESIYALVTRQSVEDLALRAGERVTASFKASAVHVFPARNPIP